MFNFLFGDHLWWTLVGFIILPFALAGAGIAAWIEKRKRP